MRSASAGLAVLLLIALVPSPALAQPVPDHHVEFLDLLDADIETYPYSYSGRLGLARALALARYREESVAAYTKMLEDHPGNSDVLLGRAITYSWMGEYELAEQDLQQVIQSGSAYTDHWALLGTVYSRTGRTEDGIEALTRAIEMSPERASLYVARARAKLSAGHAEEAREDLVKARELGADDSEVQPLLTRVQRQLFPDDIPGDRWSTSAGFGYVSVADRDPWRSQNLSVSWRLRVLLLSSVNLRVAREERFNRTQHSYALTGYFSGIWPGAGGSVRYLTSSRSDNFLPDHDLRLEVLHSFGGGWVGLANYRHMNFGTTKTNIFGTGLERYFGRWYSRVNLHLSRNQRGERGLSQALTVRNYYAGTADNFIELRGGYGRGREFTSPQEIEQITAASWSVGARWERLLTERVGLSVSVSHRDDETEPNRTSYSISLGYNW